MELFMASRPETVALFIDFHKKAYKGISGKTFVVDHDQQMIMIKDLMKADLSDSNRTQMWKAFTSDLSPSLHIVNDLFLKGCDAAIYTMDLDDMFVAATAYYDMLYNAHMGSKQCN